MSGLTRFHCTADMCFQIWNPYLASMAADWADTCEYGHGQPARDANTMPFDPIGQNLYLTSSNTIDLSSAIQAWYDEISDYDYDTRACSGVCGHYTQVRQIYSVRVWSLHTGTPSAFECDQETKRMCCFYSHPYLILSYCFRVLKNHYEDMNCLQVVWA